MCHVQWTATGDHGAAGTSHPSRAALQQSNAAVAVTTPAPTSVAAPALDQRLKAKCTTPGYPALFVVSGHLTEVFCGGLLTVNVVDWTLWSTLCATDFMVYSGGLAPEHFLLQTSWSMTEA